MDTKARVSSLNPAVLASPAVSITSVEVAGHAIATVMEPPRRPDPQRRVVSGQRRELAGIRALIEGEDDQGQSRIVAEFFQERAQVPGELRRHRDVRAHVGSEPLEHRPVVVPGRADVELHDQAVVDAHPGELDEHVAGEPPRIVG